MHQVHQIQSARNIPHPHLPDTERSGPSRPCKPSRHFRRYVELRCALALSKFQDSLHLIERELRHVATCCNLQVWIHQMRLAIRAIMKPAHSNYAKGN